MLKECIINNEKINVPVPLMNVGEMLDWASSLGSESGGVVTRILIDGEDISGKFNEYRSKVLDNNSMVVLNIDTPLNLVKDVLSAVVSMLDISCFVIKDLAVSTWKLESISIADRRVVEDIKMMKELLSAVLSMVEENKDQNEKGEINLSTQSVGSSSGYSKFNKVEEEYDLCGDIDMLERVEKMSKEAIKNKDYKEFASILLNDIEPFFKELRTNLESLYYSFL